MNVIDLVIANAPTIVSVLAALGLWRAGAAVIRTAIGKARAMAASTPSPIDDQIVSVVASHLEDVASLLERGQVTEARYKLGLVASQAKRASSSSGK